MEDLDKLAASFSEQRQHLRHQYFDGLKDSPNSVSIEVSAVYRGNRRRNYDLADKCNTK